MKRVFALFLLALPATCLAGPKKEVFGMPCSKLWPDVVSVARSKQYHFPVIDTKDRTGSVSLGHGNWFAGNQRTIQFGLRDKGTACTLEVTNKFSGFINHDAPDFIKRVQKHVREEEPPAKGK